MSIEKRTYNNESEYCYNLSEEYNDYRERKPVKYELNLINLPFFLSNKNIDSSIVKNYIFSETESMRVIPSKNPKMISNKIPQEFDEKVFFGILQLSEMQGSNTVVTDYLKIAQSAGVSYHNLQRIKDSVERLANTVFEFNNVFICAGRGICNELSFSLISSFSLAKKGNKNILTLTIAEPVYNNLKAGLFLSTEPLDKRELFSLNVIERKIYLMLMCVHTRKKLDSFSFDCKSIALKTALPWNRDVTDSIRCIASAVSRLNWLGWVVLKLVKRNPLSDSYVRIFL